MKRDRILPIGKPWWWRLADAFWRAVFTFTGPR